MTRSDSMWSSGIFGFALALIVCAMLFVPPIAQNASYHEFADERVLLGIPNFWNVASNLCFLLAAIFGACLLRSRSASWSSWIRTGFAALVAGTFFVGFGSAYYHLNPGSKTLFWDRLPMTIVFMSIFALTLGDRVREDIGRNSLFPLLAIGTASVLYWRATGDLRFYAIVQFYPMLAIPLLMRFRTSHSSSGPGLAAMIVFYAAAKILELFDRQIGAFLPVGGHPWKHVLAAAALVCFMASSPH